MTPPATSTGERKVGFDASFAVKKNINLSRTRGHSVQGGGGIGSDAQNSGEPARRRVRA